MHSKYFDYLKLWHKKIRLACFPKLSMFPPSNTMSWEISLNCNLTWGDTEVFIAFLDFFSQFALRLHRCSKQTPFLTLENLLQDVSECSTSKPALSDISFDRDARIIWAKWIAIRKRFAKSKFLKPNIKAKLIRHMMPIFLKRGFSMPFQYNRCLRVVNSWAESPVREIREKELLVQWMREEFTRHVRSLEVFPSSKVPG